MPGLTHKHALGTAVFMTGLTTCKQALTVARDVWSELFVGLVTTLNADSTCCQKVKNGTLHAAIH